MPQLFRFLVALFLGAVATVAAAQDRPLVMDGTSTVYQRVLTRPGAVLHAAPGGEAVRQYPAFQPLYVFERADGWVRVGPASRAAEGWIAAEASVEWRQNIVAAFTNAAGRSRQLLFESEDELRRLMEHEALRTMQERLLNQADTGTLPPDAGIVAVEPQDYVDIVEELYLMPILDFREELHPLNYEDTLLMEVASVPLREDAGETEPAADTADDFDTGIVFVLDTTQSMEPYIERTRRALERIVNRIEGTEIGDRVNFGVVAFRDNVDAVPALEYRTRTLMPLDRRDDQGTVVEAIARADVARVSTPGFNEDSLAGVEDAVDAIDWERGGDDPFDARYVILVTDAGPKDPRDPNARSRIGAAEIQAAAEDEGIVVMTLHLKTDIGVGNHAFAGDSYRALSVFAGNTYYYPIEGGSEDAFEETIGYLVTAITDTVRSFRGEATEIAPDALAPELADLGLAMQLRYLGRSRGTQAPDVIEGWVSEKAVETPTRRAIEPRLLITKNEMATMADLLREIMDLGEQAREDCGRSSFFDQVQGVVARMAQDPQRLVAVDPEATTLGGALEFLEMLPYRSQLLQVDQTFWCQSAMTRRSILDGMRQKLTQYRKWLFDPNVWTPLYAGSPDGEHVFAMPFDVLP